MTGCNTGRNIQKYKGGGASTLQDALENSNTASLNINLSSPAVFVGDGGGLSNINASATSGNLQAVTDNAATTTNKITLTNGLTSLVTSGNVLVTGNVTASFFRGDGGTLSNVAANKNFQEVTDFGSTSSNKITLTNGVTSLQASGNVSVTGNVTASKFYGDGTTLTGVALSTDLASNSTRIGTVSTDLASNASRIGVVETDLASNSTRIGTVSTDLTDNASRINTLESETQPVNRGGTGHGSYFEGQILMANTVGGSVTLTKLTPGESGFFLKSEGDGSHLVWANVATIGSATPASLSADGTFLKGGPFNGSSPATFTVQATTINTASKLVARDSSGDIFVQNLYTAGGIELGHASDTTLARSEAGKVTIEGAEVRTGTVARGDGGTGRTDYSMGDILYGATSGTTLNKLSPAGSNADVGKFLKLGDSDVPEWSTVSVSPTTMTVTNDADSTNDQGIIYAEGTGTKSLESDATTLKYKRSTGTLTTGRIVTSDTSVDARNGIANDNPTSTLSVGTVVSIRESDSGDVFIVRKGNGYFSEDVYIAKKLTIPVGGEIVADKITVRSLETKGSIVIANRPPTSGIVLG